MAKNCYVNSLAQISCQSPLVDDWFDSPCMCNDVYVRAQEADVKGLIAPGEARRMSRILKRVVCTSLTSLSKSGIQMPDAIITGTGMGCMENSEKFLVDLCKYGESCLKPTLFMQSTHNTISSLIAIMLKCHGYNNTYSHQGVSFESALFDAWLQIKSNQINNALVGSHDEVTPFTAQVLKKVYPQYSFMSETSVSVVVSNEKAEGSLAEIVSVDILHRHDAKAISKILSQNQNDVLVLGVNGNEINDKPYIDVLSALIDKPCTLQYRNIFGDNFSSSAMSLCVGALLLSKQRIPSHFAWNCNVSDMHDFEYVTLVNCSEGNTWSVVRLKKI